MRETPHYRMIADRLSGCLLSQELVGNKWITRKEETPKERDKRLVLYQTSGGQSNV